MKVLHSSACAIRRHKGAGNQALHGVSCWTAWSLYSHEAAAYLVPDHIFTMLRSC